MIQYLSNAPTKVAIGYMLYGVPVDSQYGCVYSREVMSAYNSPPPSGVTLPKDHVPSEEAWRVP